MKFALVSGILALAGLAALSFSSTSAQDDASRMAEMLKKSEPFMKPGEHHKLLEKFLGKWKTETRMYFGDKITPPEMGTAEFTWLMPGRWLQGTQKGTVMGAPAEMYRILGYDNFKMSYVSTAVGSFDTAMMRFEGDLTPDGKALISYGTIDEYTTGEHDKKVKNVYRFIDADTILFEVHDLPIGEVNTKVFDVKYTRVK